MSIYIIYLNEGVFVEASDREEAKQKAREKFIEMLKDEDNNTCLVIDKEL